MTKKILPVTWILSVALLALLATLLSGESTHFFGIADDNEQTISFEQPVEIVRTLVVEGEIVKQGDLLVEVRRDTLNSDLAIIDDELQELRVRYSEETATLQSQLISLTARQEAQRVDFDSQINALNSRYELNKSFLDQLNSSGEHLSLDNDGDEPLLDEIAGLEQQRNHLMKSLQAEIDNIKSQLNASKRPMDGKIAAIEEKKLSLIKQASSLKIRANFNGRVGSLLYKAGETVSPYTPILTVHGASPSYVKAYINENVVNKVKLGQEVWVQSSTSTMEKNIISGRVESLGSRIVEYPERLKKNRFVSAWGREVVVRLEQEHNLLLGEKVMVQLNKPDSLLTTMFTSSEAVASVVSKTKNDPHNSNVPVYSITETEFILSSTQSVNAAEVEASGLLFDDKRMGYLLIGDEASKKAIDLYYLDGNGIIVNKESVNSGSQKLPNVDDLESISKDENYIYLLSSLSKNKKNQVKKKRQQLVRLERVNNEYIYRDSVNLYEYLEKLVQDNTTEKNSRKFLQHAILSGDIDIEAHSVSNNNLYLGFKKPLNNDNESIILKLNNVDLILSGLKTTATTWFNLDLRDSATGEPTLISDMLFEDNRILLLSVKEDKTNPSSYFWSLDLTTEEIKKLAKFEGMKAEGIARDGYNLNQYMIVFDAAGKTASRKIIVNTEAMELAGVPE